jgi:hypothetical protein
MGRRYQRHVQKLQQSRIWVLSDGILRTIGVETSGHINRDTQLPGHPVERDGAPPQ